MPPVAIFRHAASEGPGYLAEFLDAQAIPWRLIAIDAGAAVPDRAQDFSGLVLMGGPMSVNDDLPWIAPLLALIRQAVAADIPVLGHCLGGQLMARALGGAVTHNPVKEIGWGRVEAVPGPEAEPWLGAQRAFEAFHWHGETFSLPPGAHRILAGAHCANQAFALGPHLALQCHVEMTPAMIAQWCELGAAEIAAARSPAVQGVAEILALTPSLQPALQAVADTLYRRWVSGLPAPT